MASGWDGTGTGTGGCRYIVVCGRRLLRFTPGASGDAGTGAGTGTVVEVELPPLPSGDGGPIEPKSVTLAVVDGGDGPVAWVMGGYYRALVKGVKPVRKTFSLDLRSLDEGADAAADAAWVSGPELYEFPRLWSHHEPCRAVAVGAMIHVFGNWHAHLVIDTAARTVMTLAPVPTKRKDAALAVLGDGRRVVVLGGDTGPKYSAAVEVFDTVSGEWATLPNLRCARTDFAAVFMRNPSNDAAGNGVFAIGGHPPSTSLESLSIGGGVDDRDDDHKGEDETWEARAEVPAEGGVWKDYDAFDGALIGLPGSLMVMSAAAGLLEYNLATGSWVETGEVTVDGVRAGLSEICTRW